MLKSLLRRACAALGLSLLLSAAPAAAQAPQQAHPALWAVSDRDTTIYLFGTIHLLPPNYRWRTPEIDQAIKGSSELVVETIVDDKNPASIVAALNSLAFNTPNLPPLADRVPLEKRPALAAAIKESGFAPQALDRMETWAAAVLLLGNEFRALGLKSDEGVEFVLRNAFTTAGKPIDQLETNVEQFSFFDRLPEQSQRALLEGSIDPVEAMRKEFGEMLTSWSSGDVKGIALTFDRDLAASPQLQQSLIRQRNANWSHWIERRMQQPGKIMIAVGAGHLAGNDSVIALLKKDGYRVHRVQ